MKTYAYVFRSYPKDNNLHFECIEHACALASLYNDVFLVFLGEATLNLSPKYLQQREKVYSGLELFGIKNILIEEEALESFALPESIISIAKVRPIAECLSLIASADVVF